MHPQTQVRASTQTLVGTSHVHKHGEVGATESDEGDLMLGVQASVLFHEAVTG